MWSIKLFLRWWKDTQNYADNTLPPFLEEWLDFMTIQTLESSPSPSSTSSSKSSSYVLSVVSWTTYVTLHNLCSLSISHVVSMSELASQADLYFFIIYMIPNLKPSGKESRRWSVVLCTLHISSSLLGFHIQYFMVTVARVRNDNVISFLPYLILNGWRSYILLKFNLRDKTMIHSWDKWHSGSYPC